jgi:hypothetical protein
MTAKCNRCNLPIDRERDAFVTMPNPEQCGYGRRRPTAFAHARCFEKDIKADHERFLNSQKGMAVTQ